jgi:hypothetical protein
MRGRGFLARFLYALPPSKVGGRQIAPPRRSSQLDQVYGDNVEFLWYQSGSGQKATVQLAEAAVLPFSAAADAALAALEAWLEPQLAPGGPLAELAGWANKLAGAIARLAGVLELAAAMPPHQHPLPAEVSAAAVHAAIRLGRDYLLPHAQLAFGLMGLDEKVEQAMLLLDRLRRQGRPAAELLVVTRRELFVLGRHRFKTVDKMDPALDLLCRHGWLRPTGEGVTGKGHRSPTFLVHPQVFAVD